MNVADVAAWLEGWAPVDWAEDWDRVGLQIGSPEQPCRKVLCALDADARACERALEGGFDLLLVHHPPLFRPLAELRMDHPEGARLVRLAAQGVAVYAAHTNLDAAPGGVNDVLLERLGLEPEGVLFPAEADAYLKLVVFVPEGHEDAVREAVSAAGAGCIGGYSECTFQVAGEGTFRPGDGTDPYIGEAGRLERVPERRIETILPASAAGEAVRAMLSVHPYEEPAYDLYPLAGPRPPARRGLGRIGRLPQPVALTMLAERCARSLGVRDVRWLGDAGRRIETVAVLGGSGGDWIEEVSKRARVDAFITGDIKYHQAQKALDAGLALIDAGHDGTEWPVVEAVADRLRGWAAEQGADLAVEALPPAYLWQSGRGR